MANLPIAMHRTLNEKKVTNLPNKDYDEALIFKDQGICQLAGIHLKLSPASFVIKEDCVMSGKRIVSLIASATEILCALGFEEDIVGRSHECDYPVSVKKLPVCTEANLDSSATSLEIDNQVKTILQNALSVYRIKEDLLKDLAPDVIVTQSQCEVCAVSLNEVEKAVKEWVDSSTKIVSLEPNSIEDVWSDIGKVARALEAPQLGARLIAQLKSRMAEINRKTSSLRRRPAIACIEWIDPLMAAGNWMPELVEMAGGENLFGEAGKHSPWMTWEELEAEDPEVIVVLPCGFDLGRTREEMGPLTARPGWSELRAVHEGRVCLTDGNQYFNRPGPRIVEALEMLAEILHPGDFNFGHCGTGWDYL